MNDIARIAHVAAAWLFAAGVLLQGYLAGTAMGHLGGSGDFGAHVALGYSLMGILPVIAALHPVNAMILFVLAGVVAVRCRRLMTASTAG